MKADINTRPPIGDLRICNRPRDAEDIPIGSTVQTPLGLRATVVAYRGGRRMGGGDKDNHERLVCRYINPKNRRWAVVVLRAELVQVVPKEECHEK